MTAPELPPLPEPIAYRDANGRGVFHEEPMFTADQMREYAMQAVLAEREANAKICEAQHFGGDRDDDLGWTSCAAVLAAAIRAQGEVK